MVLMVLIIESTVNSGKKKSMAARTENDSKGRNENTGAGRGGGSEASYHFQQITASVIFGVDILKHS